MEELFALTNLNPMIQFCGMNLMMLILTQQNIVESFGRLEKKSYQRFTKPD